MKLAIPRFKQADYVRTVHAIVPEDGTPYEALFEPSYWAHVAEKMKPFDRVEVRAEDGSYYAELIVLASERLAARVAEIVKVDLEVPEQEINSEYKVKWKGPQHKWAVVRISDGETVHKGSDTPEQAQKALAELVKTLHR